MRYRCSLVMGVFVGCLLAPALAYSDDVEDLKAAYDQWLQAYNARDLDTVMSFYHDPMVVYLHFDNAPVEAKAVLRQKLQEIYRQVEHLSLNPKAPQFRVVGTTGIIWAPYSYYLRSRSAIREFNTFGRLTLTFVKTAGQWLIVSQHTSSAVLETDRTKIERARQESRKVQPGSRPSDFREYLKP